MYREIVITASKFEQFSTCKQGGVSLGSNGVSIVGTVLSGLNREVVSLGSNGVSIVGTVLSGLNRKVVSLGQ